MTCDVCGKNQATVHLTEIIDEQMTELHLCESCAKAKSMEMEQQFGLGDLLAGLSHLGKNAVDEKEAVKVKCPACGFTYNDFRKIGRLGCSVCYSSFKKYLVSLLRRIHGSSKHCGKAPFSALPPVKVKTELEELRQRMQRLIQTEEFEEAARVRDKIKELEKNGEPQAPGSNDQGGKILS